MAKKKSAKQPKKVEAITHGEAKRRNIPTAEYQSVMQKEQQEPLLAAYERRNRDLDPQLVWRGKDMLDWSDLVVQVPPLYIQEKIHPKVLIDDLRRQTSLSTSHSSLSTQLDLFADFNGLPDDRARTEFYQHDQNWSNRMILGDSLQVMASLAEREGLRGKVQCIYIDPPYGIKFNSNFQWSTISRDVKDGKADHITREPEQVKAFRDTWRDGIHSYLTYLRDRLTVARDLLTDSGSIFVQIGDENVHRVRALMDEVFGEDNCCAQIVFQKTSGAGSPGELTTLAAVNDYLLWYAKDFDKKKFRPPMVEKVFGGEGAGAYRLMRRADGSVHSVSPDELARKSEDELRALSRIDNLLSQSGVEKTKYPVQVEGKTFSPNRGVWKTSEEGMQRLLKASRVSKGVTALGYIRQLSDFAAIKLNNTWTDTTISGSSNKVYVVQTSEKVVQRCLLMTTDPGDLVLDPTCGSGTTAYVAEQWGRRWITIDTSRVALALARARIMGARYPYYLLADSKAGQEKEAELTRTAPSQSPTYGDIRQGFVYERVPHITLKSIANNAEIDVIWERWQLQIAPLLEQLSAVVSGQGTVDRGKKKAADKKLSTEHHPLSTPLEEWQVPREFPEDWPADAKPVHARFWEARIARQKEIDASIAAKADYEYLYDKPYEDKKTVRVAGPFTVESLSPHRVLGVDENDELIDQTGEAGGDYGRPQDFATMILENLRTAGVQQAHKEDKIVFTSLTPWPGEYICAEGRFEGSEKWIVDSDGKGVDSDRKEGDGKSKQSTSHQSLSTKHYLRAGILIGPEFGTVSRPDLVAAAREAGDADFDVLIACAFNYDAHASEFNQLGRVPVLKARMNADLHMADDLKNTGKGNLFVIFGEPDIDLASEEWIVDSDGRRVAPYEICKLVSGLGSLEEINGLGDDDLRDYAAISLRREIWDYLTDAAGGNIDSGQHRRRSGEAYDGGVSAVAWHCAGLAGGARDVPGFIAALGDDRRAGLRKLVERLRGNQPDASRADENSGNASLATIHYPLSTNHFIQVTINGVDVFHPNTGEIRSDGAEGIACWFIDTDYNEESFFVRHAYFLGANDPYKSLKTTLKAEINEEAWDSLHSDTSRPFDKPANGRIAVKVINHLGDEVMKVFRV